MFSLSLLVFGHISVLAQVRWIVFMVPLAEGNILPLTLAYRDFSEFLFLFYMNYRGSICQIVSVIEGEMLIFRCIIG